MFDFDFTNNGLFQPKHICILIVAFLIFIPWTIFALKKLKIQQFEKILLISAIVSETVKAITYVINNEPSHFGYLDKGDLPLHLCSFQIILFIILNFSKNDKLKRTIYGFQMATCLIGGIGAMFVATTSSRSIWGITITYFLYHDLLASWAIYLIAKKDLKLNVRDYLSSMIMFALIMIIGIYINAALYDDPSSAATYHGVNYMYVVYPPVDGLPLLTTKYGWGVYIAHYFCLWIIMISICYGIKALLTRKPKKVEVEQPKENKIIFY